MRLVVLLLAGSLLAGFLLGGSLRNLAELELRLWGLALVGYGLQVFPYPESWGHDIPIAALLLSFVLLLAFAAVNLGKPGFALIILGVILNFTVIAANWGMPVSAVALVGSDQEAVLAELRVAPGQKHHLAGAEDHFRFLGDVIPVPAPIRLAISAGDVLLYCGIAVLIVVAMRAPPTSAPPAPASSDRTEP